MNCADIAHLAASRSGRVLTADPHKLCCTSVWSGVVCCSAARPAAATGIPAGNRGGWQPGCCWSRGPSSSRASARGFLWATHSQHASAVPSCQRSCSQHQVGAANSTTRGCCQHCATCCLRQDQLCAVASKQVPPACAPCGSCNTSLELSCGCTQRRLSCSAGPCCVLPCPLLQACCGRQRPIWWCPGAAVSAAGPVWSAGGCCRCC